MKKKRNKIKDILNAVKARQRLEEIRYFGKQLNYASITKNKKKYSRKIKHKKKDVF